MDSNVERLPHTHPGEAPEAGHNPELVVSTAVDKAQKIKKGFDDAWRNEVRQFQAPLYSPNTKGQWIIRFDTALADGLELGPLRSIEFEKRLPAHVRSGAFL